MKISKKDVARLHELKGNASWHNVWTWVGQDSQRFINKMVKADVMFEKPGENGYKSTYHLTDSFIEILKMLNLLRVAQNE